MRALHRAMAKQSNITMTCMCLHRVWHTICFIVGAGLAVAFLLTPGMYIREAHTSSTTNYCVWCSRHKCITIQFYPFTAQHRDHHAALTAVEHGWPRAWHATCLVTRSKHNIMPENFAKALHCLHTQTDTGRYCRGTRTAASRLLPN